jgi:3-hydroxyisobutyrate dehydrogenase-like beta-hydroxyacid dehydrogenase
MASEPVGLVGVGAMGSAFLQRLSWAGRSVVAYDAVPACREAARAGGAQVAASLAEVAQRTRLIDVWVRGEQDVLDCMTGPGGILEAAAAGTLVLLHPTVRPRITQQVAEAAAPRGVLTMDVTVSAIPSALRAGQATFFAGGDPELMAQVRPHLLQVGRQVFYMGPLGYGNATKLVKNYVTAAETFVVEEALRVADAFGIPQRVALDMMVASYTGSVLQHWERVFDAAGHDTMPRANELMMGKDIPLFTELGHELGVPVPVAERLTEAGQRVLKARGRG